MNAEKKRKTSEVNSFADGKVMNAEQVAPRGKRDSEGTKSDILLAAMHEFSEYGDSGARIDRIAHRANANKSLIYSYFGNKEKLYAHALREAYAQIRRGEKELDLDQLEPTEAIRKLIQYTMDHYLKAPWFLRMLATENLRRGKTIENIADIAELQSPLIKQLSLALERGAKAGIFREDVDPVDLYILIASFFYFPIANSYTLSVVFGAKVSEPSWLQERLRLVEEMVLTHLEKKAD